ncbi:DUF4190 domain-containing protein, partial [Streptomyces phyllanthi]
GRGEPVPPPPISPDGPGQVPYGYPQYPGYVGHPGHPGHGNQFAPYPRTSYPHALYQGAAGYGWPGMPPEPSNGMGIASLSLGIIGAVLFCLWPLAIVLGALALIFGVIGHGKARRGEATNPGQALAGMICGAVGIALGLLALLYFVVLPEGGGGADNDAPFGDGHSTSLVVPHTAHDPRPGHD